MRSGVCGEPGVRGARPFAVTVLEAEVDRPADGEAIEVLVRSHRRRCELGQDVEGCLGIRILRHPGQIDELLDRARAELRPNPRVFLPRLLVGWVQRPFDATVPE